MGRLESLTAWALGRTPYEDEVAELPEAIDGVVQQYNEHGRPRNPETKRRERENVRTANEVMLVTGIVEDALAAKLKAKTSRQQKNRDTLTGLRLMELGRATLVGGVWGVLGLRRRILIYKPYSELTLIDIMRHENEIWSISNLLFSGLPTVLAYHISDWVGFVAVDVMLDDDEKIDTPTMLWMKRASQILLETGFCYVTLTFRMFAILQQLHFIPGSRLLPSFTSFIPFSAASPLQLPPAPSSNVESILSWGAAMFYSAAPFLMILAHGKVKFFIARLLYRPIYKSLPRPIGDSIFSGLSGHAPLMEFDTPDIAVEEERSRRGEDTPTLRALEGLPALEGGEREETRMHHSILDHGDESSEDGNDEMHQATLISFDVEATEAVENSLGTWSAELRSANEPVPMESINYRTTGLTMLPVILAAEGLREIFAGLLVLPLEAVMVRVIARAYRHDAGLGVADLCTIGTVKGFLGRRSLVGIFALQVVLTGAIWAGFTVTSQWLTGRGRGNEEDRHQAPP